MDRESIRRRIGNVLVGTDFAHHSHDALARAAWLPIGPGCRVTVVHALPPDLPPKIDVHVRRECEALMRLAVDTLRVERERCGDAPFEISTVIESGRAAELIDVESRDRRAELVVIGGGRRHGLGEAVLGSTAERIVRACRGSVLVARSTPQHSYLKPMVAVDFSELSSHALELALRLSDSSVNGVELVHAYELPYLTMLHEGGWSARDLEAFINLSERAARENLTQWMGGVPQLGVPLVPRVFFGDPRRELATEAKDAELLVVGSHGRRGIARLFLGSVAEGAVRTAKCDVLVVR